MAEIILGYGEGKSVASALEKAIKEVNEKLKNCEGCIKKINPEVTLLPVGAYVYITVIVSGEKLCEKKVVGVNVKASSKKKSIEKAFKLINPIDGEIADFSITTSTSPTLGIYTTVIVGVNKIKFKKAKNQKERRERIRKILEILGNDLSAINLSGLAAHFNVSRTTIYKDLQEIMRDLQNLEEE